jgi:hypothetical protein
VIVVDNVTSPANVTYLENLMLDCPWYYLKSTAYNQDNNVKKPYDPSWVSMIYNNGEILSPLMQLTHSILIKALHDQKLSMSKLVRIRAGLTTRTPYPVTHEPHVDWDDDHMTGLYYVNDSDGDTIFYNETRDPNLNTSSFEWSKDRKFTINKTVIPKADRFVIFNGLNYHSSTSPVNTDYRIIINYNWIP